MSTRSKSITYLYDNINKLDQDERQKVLNMLVTLTGDSSILIKKVRGTQFKTKGIPTEVFEKINSYIKSRIILKQKQLEELE